MRGRGLLRATWPWLVPVLLLTLAAGWLPLLPILGAVLSPAGVAFLADPRLLGLFLESARLAAGAGLLAFLLGLPLALLLGRTDVPGRALWSLLLPLPLLLPPLLLAQAWHGLTGWDGRLAAVFVLGCCHAPFAALLALLALSRQSAAAHETALLAGGPRLAASEMLRTALPAAILGGCLAFLLALADFAVPDYFAWIGERFSVYSFEVFTRWTEDPDPAHGARAAAPLVFLAALVLALGAKVQDRLVAAEPGDRPPRPLPLGRLRLPALGLVLALLAVLLLLPLGRVVWETGRAGAAATGNWIERSAAAFGAAVEQGRESYRNSLVLGVSAGVLVAVLAPCWAHLLLGLRRPGLRRLALVALSLPLLAPGVGFGLGGILVYNHLSPAFYQSAWLPPLLLAGRLLPVAVFLLLERFRRVPASQEEAARLAGASYPARVFRYRPGRQAPAILLAAGLVAALAVRELDLAILLPGANPTAVVRYYNALHFGRDNFVAAFGLLLALILFLPVALPATLRLLRPARP